MFVRVWGGAALFVLLSLFYTPSALARVQTVDLLPEAGVCSFDRVDINWTLDAAGVDSVTVDFGDGRRLTVDPAITTARHFYELEGSYDVSFTAWIGGEEDLLIERDLVQVTRRPVPGLNVMFLHHSTGRYMMRDSGFRSLVDAHNAKTGLDIRFWDHDYASGNAFTGIIRPDSSVYSDWIYGYEANNIMPDGYYDIFVQAPAFRDSLFNRHDVIAFKNDHRTGDILSESELQQHKDNYLEIRNVLDQFPEKLFILVSGSSRQPAGVSVETADRARRFYDWLQSPEFMGGRTNIAFFDLFDELSNPDDPSNPERNMLRPEYRVSDQYDDHPNEFANQTIGPKFADFLLRVLDPAYFNSAATPVPVPGPANAVLHAAVPNPFNPATVIAYELAEPATVSLTVFDLSGRLVTRLVSAESRGAGRHEAVWRGQDAAGRTMPSGVYLYRLTAGREVQTKRMSLVR